MACSQAFLGVKHLPRANLLATAFDKQRWLVNEKKQIKNSPSIFTAYPLNPVPEGLLKMAKPQKPQKPRRAKKPAAVEAGANDADDSDDASSRSASPTPTED